MLAEFMTRLMVALPLVCLLAVATILAMRRGWLPMPGLRMRPGAGDKSAPTELDVRCVKALSPTARIAIVSYRGRALLLGVTPQTVVVLAEDPGTSVATASEPHA